MPRKTVFTLLTLFAFALNSYGQKGHFLGVYAFPQLTSITSSFDLGFSRDDKGLGDDFELLPTIGYGGGVTYYYISSSYFGFKTGLQFSNQGQRYASNVRLFETDSFNTSYTSRVNLNYLKMPLLTHFTIIDENTRAHFTLQFGFQLGYLVGGNYSITVKGYEPNYSLAITDAFNRLEASYIIGGDLLIELNEKKTTLLQIGVQYDKTIGGIDNYDRTITSSTPMEHRFPVGTLKYHNYPTIPGGRTQYNTKNETFQVRMGLVFRLKEIAEKESVY
ncbi:MAG: PorT family protein [Bacteroidetes bacterium]|nr:PorT family protein [Bacteroidota bacterium]